MKLWNIIACFGKIRSKELRYNKSMPNDIETIATEIAPGVDPDSSAEEIAEMVVQLGYSIHTALHVVQHFGRLYCGCGPSWNYGGGR